MFERFTERARQVVVFAQDEARALRHGHIGTEHLLLGLFREEEGMGAHVLESLDITFEEVRAQVERIIGVGDEPTAGQIPFTPRAKKALELGLREALSLGHNHVGTEHVLLGLVRVDKGVAARILVDFDADAETIRSEVIRQLSGPGRESRGRPGPAWQYDIVVVGGEVTLELLNARGAEGWELVAVLSGEGEQRLVFKRPKPPG